MACSRRRQKDVKRTGRVSSVEPRRRLCLTSIPALLVQRRFRWLGHAARHPDGELIKGLLLLKKWATTIKVDLEHLSGPRVFGYARWRKDWVKGSSEFSQDRRA